MALKPNTMWQLFQLASRSQNQPDEMMMNAQRGDDVPLSNVPSGEETLTCDKVLRLMLPHPDTRLNKGTYILFLFSIVRESVRCFSLNRVGVSAY